MQKGWKRRYSIPPQKVTPGRWGNSVLMMSEAQSTPHRRSPSPIQHSKCACQFQCQRPLYAGPCAPGTDARSPVAYSGSANSNLQRTISGVLEGTYLFAELEHPFHGNTNKDCGWAGFPCQPDATGSPPNKDFQEIPWQTPKGWVLEALDLQGLRNGPNWSRNRPENCCSNGSTCFPVVTWTWAKQLWSSTK